MYLTLRANLGQLRFTRDRNYFIDSGLFLGFGLEIALMPQMISTLLTIPCILQLKSVFFSSGQFRSGKLEFYLPRFPRPVDWSDRAYRFRRFKTVFFDLLEILI